MGEIKVYGTVQETPPEKKSYTHYQLVAAAEWNVAHGLGFKPAGIEVYDSAGSKWHPSEVEHLNNNELILRFGGFIVDGNAKFS